jgi:hypothetical protein
LGALSVPGGSASLVTNITGDLGKLVVTSDVRRTELFVSGSVRSVAINGSFVESALRVGAILGPTSIRGDLVGESVANPSVVSALGRLTAPVNGADIAIQSVSVAGRVEFVQIQAGYDTTGYGLNADASIGAVTVGTDWIASILVAGTAAGTDGFFGTADDVKITGIGTHDTLKIFSQIASVTIKGQAYGTVAATDAFGIVAEQINKARIGTRKFPFVRGPRSASDFFYAASTGPGATGELSDFALFELQM